MHIGCCIASLLAQGGPDNYRLKWRWLRHFNNDRDRRDIITCGASSGVCAAFRSPVGGVLFSLEEVATWWRSALLWRTFFSTAVVVVILRAFIEICNSGKCGLFGKGGLIMFDVSDVVVTYQCDGCHPYHHSWHTWRNSGKPLQLPSPQGPCSLQSHQPVSRLILIHLSLVALTETELMHYNL